MNARFLRDVFTQVIDHDIHHLDGIERRTTAIGCRGGVRGDPVEAELGAGVGEVLVLRGVVGVAGMEIERHVDVFEQAIAHHVDLAAATLLRRRAVKADLSLGPGFIEPLLYRDRGRHRSRAEHIVAAAMARNLTWDRLALGDSLLRQAGQRINLSEDRNHRTVIGARARNERCRNAGDTDVDLEACLRELALQQRRGLVLLIAKLRHRPRSEKRPPTSEAHSLRHY